MFRVKLENKTVLDNVKIWEDIAVFDARVKFSGAGEH